MKTYKIYKIKFNNGIIKKTYLIASTCVADARQVAIDLESHRMIDGSIDTPPIDYFDLYILDGLYSCTAGVKSIIY